MKPAGRRALKGMLLAVVGLLVGFCIAGYVMMIRTLPHTEGTISLDKLEQDVNITFDSMGIPQIWAESEKDAIFALGYQHVADRMFQMDLIRRLSQGRLSEMLGNITVETDIRQRMVGHTRMARNAMEHLSETNKKLLQAYTDGINSYLLHGGSAPFEYKLLPVVFEPWTIYDCLTVLSFQTWFSDALQNRDRTYLELLDKVTPKQARDIVGTYPDWAPATVPDMGTLGCLHKQNKDVPIRDASFSPAKTPDNVSNLSSSSIFQKSVAATLIDRTKPTLTMSTASNSWVVSPDKSVSGHAMLACDPHLEIGRLPQFW